jgi:hypothetical protein
MHCETIKNGIECSFMSKAGCAFAGGSCRTVGEKCEGCDRIIVIAEQKYCKTFPDPSSKWRLGNCNLASHIRADSKNGAENKVRVGQQKQKKK